MAPTNDYVLVTGAHGLVGNAICDLLRKNEVRFCALVRDPIKTSKNFEVAIADLEKGGIYNLPAEIDTVIHCAARIPSQSSDFQKCAEINSAIDKNIARFVVDRGVKKLVFASTTNLYSFSSEVISEDSDVQVDNAYAEAKLESERMFSEISGASKFCLRLNAPYGFKQTHETVLSIFIRKALANENIFYHGTGSRCQDFTHVDDIAEAFLQCIQNEGSGGVYNISLGNPINMKSLAELILSLLPESTSRILPSNKPDPQEHHRALFDLTKARRDLGWTAKISLRAGISDWISRITQ